MTGPRFLLCVLLATAASACGSERTMPARSLAEPVELAATPRSALQRCEDVAASRRIRVLCPSRLPVGRWLVRYRSLAAGPGAYLTDFRMPAGAFGGGMTFHVLAGGRAGPFSLATTARGEWPVKTDRAGRTCCNSASRDLGLVGARAGKRRDFWYPVRLRLQRRVKVGRHHGLLLQAADFEAGGGIHGGHVTVVWNQGGAGYVFSLHFGEETTTSPDERHAVALAAAAAMSEAG